MIERLHGLRFPPAAVLGPLLVILTVSLFLAWPATALAQETPDDPVTITSFGKVDPELLAHISPQGWGHILLTGEYRWPKRR